MVVRGACAAVLGTMLLGIGAASAADYRADEFLSLDLARAALSPKRLGPENSFAPVAVEAKGDTASGVLPRTNPKPIAVERIEGGPLVRSEAGSAGRGRLAHSTGEPRRGSVRTQLAHRHGNPLNAQASVTHIQKWPCNPDMGGICAWQR